MDETDKKALIDELKNSLIIKKAIIDEIKEDFVLVKKGRLWHAIGGVIAALVATGLITYNTTISAAKEHLLDEATKRKIQEIHESHALVIKLTEEIEAIKEIYASELTKLKDYYSLTDKIYAELPNKLTFGDSVVIKNKALPKLLVDVQWLANEDPSNGSLLQVHQATQNNSNERAHTWVIEKK